MMMPFDHFADVLQPTQIKPPITFLVDQEPVSSRWGSQLTLFWLKTPADPRAVKVLLALIVGWKFDPDR